MHLLKIEQSGDLYASGEAVDLNQSPADMVVLTAADSEISLLAEAARQSGFVPDDANDLLQRALQRDGVSVCGPEVF